MKNIRSLVVAVLLTFVAIALLMSALQYSSDQIGVRFQNATVLSADVGVNGTTNELEGDSPDNAGTPEAGPQNSGGGGFSAINLSSLGLAGGGDPPDPEAPRDPPNYLLIVLIILVLLAFLALIGYLIWRRRRHSKETPLSPVTAATVGPTSHEGDYRIRFPQIREPFPVIWGEDEKLEVVIESKGGETDEVALDVDGKGRTDVRLEDGRALLRLELGKGNHRITVDAKGAAGPTAPSWADIRIVDYREEVVRIYNEMYLNYSSRYEGIGDKMTPRELEQAIGPNMPDVKKKALSIAVTIFELANYSLHAIRRRDYERMYLSRLDVT